MNETNLSKMTTNGTFESTKSASFSLEFQICLVGEELKENEALAQALDFYQLKIVHSETGQEFVGQGAEYTTIFVLPEFEGEVYEQLHKSGQRILGPTAIIQLAEKNEPLPGNVRPLYNISMRNLVVCFTGFRVREELSRMAALIHHMGGSIRKDFNVSKTTHLIAFTTTGEKYRYAANCCIPIMRVDWINILWARRTDPQCFATNDDLMLFKLQPFVGCQMAFLDFMETEQKHMEEVAMQNGGVVVPYGDANCTHIVVEDGSTSVVDIPPAAYSQVYIVKSEWFWATIQIEARAEERIYMYEAAATPVAQPALVIPKSAKGSKRKRLENVAYQLALESTSDIDYYNYTPDSRQKSSDVAKLSISGSFLDATMSPEKSLHDCLSEKRLTDSVIKSPLDYRTLSPKQHVCMELFQTETNYVGILHTIITVFKEPLEEPEQAGGSLLVAAEIKTIFGNLPPIYEVHQKLRTELAEVVHCWKENYSIGKLILDHAHEMLKAYPPFVNFFEKAKQVLVEADANKPRFHAFLKRCQSKPECGRQSLQELLIRPVQRLPSMILLLNDILKHSNKNEPDYQDLEKAIQAIKEVLTHINEDKRKTEGQLAMFDIVNDIENCPPHLLSSHRNFVARMDMQEIGDILSRKNDTITMFLFTDVLELCKRRRNATSLMKSPGVTSLSASSHKAQTKCFKHLELMPLSHIKRVVDIVETEDCKNVFAIVVRSNQELKERLFTFVLLGDDISKRTFLRTLCRHIANTLCKTDADNLLTSLQPHQLSLQTSDGSSNALTKAFKIATKTRDKLGRALSLRRTPSKRDLSRAVSTFISPLKNFASPSSSLRSLKLASVSNLNELDSCSSETLHPSPVCGKKMKASSLGVTVAKFR